jgi:pimeloyl-ACP methyl ester carboxylesterase
MSTSDAISQEQAPTAAPRPADDLVQRLAAPVDSTGELAARFGPQLSELQKLAALALRTKPSRGKVLILPGFMGSTLGLPGQPAPSTQGMWPETPGSLLAHFQSLALGSWPTLCPTGVFLRPYLALKLDLQIHGWAPEFYPYDWRLDLEALGAALRARMEKEAGPVSLVAHGMGGLVVRAALPQGMPNVRRFIMLGTPNQGSLAPVAALRGDHDLARCIAAASGAAGLSIADRVGAVFRTFPALYQMILGSHLHRTDLFDPQAWPQPFTAAEASLLTRGFQTPCLLASPPDAGEGPEWRLIAGINQPTKLSADVEHGGFRYGVGMQGDGVVPLDSARLEGVKTWFASVRHGELMRDPQVRAAVVDLLRSGHTEALPERAILQPSRPLIFVPEDLTALQGSSVSPGAPLSEADLVPHLWDEATPLRALEQRLAPPPLQAPRQPGFTLSGKKIRRIEIALYHGSLTHMDARAYVLSSFAGVTPQGAAHAVDDLMDGAIANLSKHNMFGARQGEVFILPTGRHLVRSEFIVFAGLGAFDQFAPQPSPREATDTLPYINEHYYPSVEAAAENAARTLASSNIESFATVLMGGSVATDLSACGESMVRGFLRGLEQADSQHTVRRVIVCEMNDTRYQHIKDHLRQLATSRLCQDVEFTFSELEVKRQQKQASTVDDQKRPPVPAYLLVRSEALAKTSAEQASERWTCSLMTPTAGAALQIETIDIPASTLEKHRGFVSDPNFHPNSEELLTMSKLLMELLPASIQQELPRLESPLIVLHDAAGSIAPWETLKWGTKDSEERDSAQRHGISRRFLHTEGACGRWKEALAPGAAVHILLISDPTRDLPGAVAEERKIRTQLGGDPRFIIDTLSQSAATRSAILAKIRTGRYDIIHYCGHAYFDATRPQASGLICAPEASSHASGRRDDILIGQDLTAIPRLPFLFFLNGCQSGRIRDDAAAAAARPSSAGTGASVAQSLLNAGIPNFIGTFWPVSDGAATDFAAAIYRSLLRDATTLGAAVIAARNTISTSPDRLDYMLYGNPNASLLDPMIRPASEPTQLNPQLT